VAKDHWTAEAQQKFDQELGTLNAAMGDLREAGRMLGGAMLLAGGAVGMVRGIIRDIIANFVAAAAVNMLAGLAAAGVTEGASIGVAEAEIEVDAARTALLCGKRVAKLVKDLSKFTKLIHELTGKLGTINKVFESAAHKAGALERAMAKKAEAEAAEAAAKAAGKKLLDPKEMISKYKDLVDKSNLPAFMRQSAMSKWFEGKVEKFAEKTVGKEVPKAAQNFIDEIAKKNYNKAEEIAQSMDYGARVALQRAIEDLKDPKEIATAASKAVPEGIKGYEEKRRQDDYDKKIHSIT
jgi:hypothetical protein